MTDILADKGTFVPDTWLKFPLDYLSRLEERGSVVCGAGDEAIIDLAFVCGDGVQFGRRPIWSIPGSLNKDQEQVRRNGEARPALGLTIT